MKTPQALAILVLGSLVGAHAAASDAVPAKARTEQRPTSGEQGSAVEAERPADASIAPYRAELVELAFESASSMPLKPHVKTRSRAQEDVVRACLALDQPQRALQYSERIADWRRGLAYAEYALYCVEHGSSADVQRYLDLAETISNDFRDDSPEASTKPDEQLGKITQDWQRDRIRVTIAKAQFLRGRAVDVARLQADAVESEFGKVDLVKAAHIDLAAAREQLASLETTLSTGSFDLVRNALDACALLFERFYDEVEFRDRVEAAMRTSWKSIPLEIRFGALEKLARSALARGGREKGSALVEDAQALLDDHRWEAEFEIPLRARAAALRHVAGDAERAKRDLASTVALFDKSRDRIVNLFRGQALRPLAEAFHAVGDDAGALAIYKRAVEEGALNPNARPRAEDLTATCLSMARVGLEPDEALWKRLREIQTNLAAPW